MFSCACRKAVPCSLELGYGQRQLLSEGINAQAPLTSVRAAGIPPRPFIAVVPANCVHIGLVNGIHPLGIFQSKPFSQRTFRVVRSWVCLFSSHSRDPCSGPGGLPVSTSL